MAKQEKILTEAELGQFHGTENHYEHWAGRILFTDGVHYVAEKAGAYWLIDAIVSYRRKEPFQIWELNKHEGKAVLTMREDTNEPVLVQQKFRYIDFPLDSIRLYLVGGVLMLPSEY